MTDSESAARSLRERLGVNTEERLGKALSDLLESSLFTGAIGRAYDARVKAAQAQQLALGVLNLPSASDIERLTRRLRAVSQRLEMIEDGVDRLDSSLARSRDARDVEERLASLEDQLQSLITKLDGIAAGLSSKPAAQPALPPGRASARASRTRAGAKATANAAKRSPKAPPAAS